MRDEALRADIEGFQVICEIWVNRANIGKNTLLSEISKLLLKLHSKYSQIRVGKGFGSF